MQTERATAEPGVGDLLDPQRLRAWSQAATAALDDHRGELDALNVFPVADSDTGTNLYLTLHDAALGVGRAGPGADVRAVAAAFVRGALVGARGNSGVIVSQYLAALLEALLAAPSSACPGLPPVPAARHDPADVPAPGRESERLAAALEHAAASAHAAVAHPVEGTVLSVARAVAHGARGALGGGSPTAVPVVLDGALRAGWDALDRTTDQLPVLRAAGVPDAGGWGLLLVLEALATALVGVEGGEGGGSSSRARAVRPPVRSRRQAVPAPSGSAPDGRPGHDGEPGHDGGALPGTDGEFEVMYLVSRGGMSEDADVVGGGAGPADVAVAVRAALSEVGESVAVVGAGGLWQVHVHTDDPLEAVAVAGHLGLAQGHVGVRHLAGQSGVHADHAPDAGLVVVTRAPGLVADLARAGAVVVLAVGERDLHDALARAAEDTGADEVVALVEGPAQGVGDRSGRVEVVDGLSTVQLVVGAATFAEARSARDVPPAVARVRTAVVASGVGGAGHADVVDSAASLLAAPGEPGPLTLVTGALVPGDLGERVGEALAPDHPGVEVLQLASGAPGAGVDLGVG